jgi:rubrerythrin
MAVPVFDFIASLERDIAAFYLKLKSVSQLARSGELFDFMATHSEGHASIVDAIARKHARPEIRQDVIKEFHDKIKESLFTEIVASDNLSEVIDKIARTEELVGKLYAVIADHYAKTANHYRAIADEITQISGEEFIHRDMALKEKEKYR